jgi:ABC-2 type transport system permease protein
MMAIIILMIEALALAGLVASEIESRTVSALLVTPASTFDVLAAKSVTGVILGVSQALVFLLATWSFGSAPVLVAAIVLLAAVMMSALGMITGAAGKDFMGTLFLGTAFLVPLIIPALSMILPGRPSLWVRALPSYGIVKSMVDVVGYGRGLPDVAPLLGVAALWTVALFALSVAILKRRVETL